MVKGVCIKHTKIIRQISCVNCMGKGNNYRYFQKLVVWMLQSFCTDAQPQVSPKWFSHECKSILLDSLVFCGKLCSVTPAGDACATCNSMKIVCIIAWETGDRGPHMGIYLLGWTFSSIHQLISADELLLKHSLFPAFDLMWFCFSFLISLPLLCQEIWNWFQGVHLPPR